MSDLAGLVVTPVERERDDVATPPEGRRDQGRLPCPRRPGHQGDRTTSAVREPCIQPGASDDDLGRAPRNLEVKGVSSSPMATPGNKTAPAWFQTEHATRVACNSA